jgi:hypothetical protein
MKRRRVALLMVTTISVAACSSVVSTSTTLGVDGAPQLIKSTFLTVARSAATLAGHESTPDQWIEFAREVCAAGMESQEDLDDFVGERTGFNADPAVVQMWTTAAGAATTSFCPMGS